MNLAESCVHRPVTTLMTITCVVVLGVIGMLKLPLNSMPDFSMNYMSVSASYPSSSPEEVEKAITIPLEDVLSTTTHLKSMSSSSRNSGASISLRFDDGVNMDLAALEIRDKLDQVRNDLPADLRRLYIFKMDPNAAPVMYMQVSWGGSATQLYHIIENVLLRKIQRVEGVANVDIRGVHSPHVYVELDKNAIDAYGVDVYTMGRSISQNNQNVSGGNIYSAGRKYAIRSIGEYRSVEEIANTPVRTNAIRLGDLADVRYGYPEKKDMSRLDGREAVMVMVQKSSNANTVQVVNRIKQVLQELKADPEYSQIDVLVLRDEGEAITTSLNALYQSGFIGALLATFVLLFFLRKFRSILVIMLAIPISVISAFLFMYLLRIGAGSTISINLISLSGLMISVGMLVDNSVVVLENIFRHKQEEDCDAIKAAVDGAKEVTMPVIAATSTTLIVFLPMFFIGSGTFQSMTRDFSIVVCVALIASLLIALTLVPLLSSRIFTGRERQTVQTIVWLRDRYGEVLRHTLRWRKSVAVLAVCLPFLAWWLFQNIDRELSSVADERTVEYRIEMPPFWTLQDMDKFFTEIEQKLLSRKDELEIKHIRSYFRLATEQSSSRYGGGRGRPSEMEIYLKEGHEGAVRDLEDLKDEINKLMPVIPGVIMQTSMGHSGHGMMGGHSSGYSRRYVTVEITGPSMQVLSTYAEELQNRLESLGVFQDVSTSLESNERELTITINRSRANLYGLHSDQVARSLSSSLGSRATSYFKTPDGEIDITMQLADEKRMTADDLGNMVFENTRGEMIPLSTLVDMRMQPAKQTIERESRRAVAKVTVRSGFGGVDARATVEQFLQNFQLPAGYNWDFGSSFSDLMQMNQEINWVIVMAILLIYIIMAALFESFIHPFTILFCLPSALVGVALAYKLTGTTLNTNSMCGILILIGIVVNNGIILVDYVNQLRERGMDRHDALVRAGRTRLRPIIMTAATTILGLAPMVAAQFLPGIFKAAQSGVSSYAPIGIAVVGGLTMSTFLTLLILPAIYLLMDDLSTWAGKVFRKLL